MLEKKKREKKKKIRENEIKKEEIEIREKVIRVWEREIEKSFLFVIIYTNL